MKLILGIIIGISLICSLGYSYSLQSNTHIDIRIITIDNHDYIVTTGLTQYGSNISVSIIHHTGCRKCREMK